MNEPAGGEARAWCPMVELDPQIVRRHLASLLAADQFAKSETSRRLLCYLVERSLGNGVPKETEIALDVFGKDASFSGAEDSVVRVGVRSLRHVGDEPALKVAVAEPRDLQTESRPQADLQAPDRSLSAINVQPHPGRRGA